MLSTLRTCASRTSSCGHKIPLLTSSPILSSLNYHHRSQVIFTQGPRLPTKHFTSQKFHDNAYPMHYPQEPRDVPAPQHTPHSSMARHVESWHKPALYKTESPNPLTNTKPEITPTQPGPESFRPSRSRPTFADNTSLELLYSLFSRRNF